MSVEKSMGLMRTYKDDINDIKTLDISELLHYLIGMGKKVEEVPAEKKTETHKIKGCVSQVYIIVDERDGLFHINVSSEAMVIKGMLAIISIICSAMTVAEMHAHGKKIIEELLGDIDLNIILTPNRTNGFGNAVAYILEQVASLLEKPL